jgi:hypothetical protein
MACSKLWFDKIADQVSNILIEKHKRKLAATDTFTHGNVFAAVISMATDTTLIPEELLR